ncbi:MAG: PmbA/TldA family metallopeptidase, partial [Terriglobia bacterium]
MRDYADTVLNHLDRREVQYADVRVVDSRERNLATKNGKVGTTSSDESLGLGVRVLSQGCWGFASTDDLSKESLAAVAAHSLAVARA